MSRLRLSLALVGCILSSVPVFGLAFPQVEAVTLNGRQLALPQAAAGRDALFVIGFRDEASKETGAWGDALDEHFPNSSTFVSYAVADLSTVPAIFRGFVEAAIRAGVSKARWDHFLVITDDAEAWKRIVDYQAGDAAYLVLIDKSGNVVWQWTGPVSRAALDSLQSAVTAS